MPALWPAGSAFVMLDGAAVQIALPASARGLARHYRIGTAQAGPDDSAAVHQVRAFAGVGLRPYRPVHLRGTVLEGGDLGIRWIRRTRIDGDSWASPEVPLGEDREAYLLRVERGGATLREVTTVVPEWRYPRALRQADGPEGSCLLRVAQLSDRWGPGPFATLQV